MKVTKGVNYYKIEGVENLESVSKLYNALSYYDDITHSLIPLACHYDETNKIFYVPEIDSFEYLSGLSVDEIAQPNKSLPLVEKVDMLNSPRDKTQLQAILFTTGTQPYQYTNFKPNIRLSLDTGLGKTYVAIATIYSNQRKAAIITKASILQVWEDDIRKHSTINNMGIIRGSKMMDKLYSGELEYDIYLFSHSTIRSWCDTNGWNKLNELFIRLGLQTLIFDEYHKEFRNICMINMFSNVSKNIYLSASSSKADYKEDKIFQRVFRNVVALEKRIDSNESNVTAFIMKFDTNPSFKDKADIMGRKGIRPPAYCKYLGSCDEYYEILTYLLNKLIPKNKGIVLFLGSLDLIKRTEKFIKENYSVSVGNFTSLVSKKNKHLELNKQVVLTTHKSMSEGQNKDDLYFVINFEPFSDKETFRQFKGRLRNKANSAVFDMLNVGFDSFMKQYNRRKKFVETTCNKIIYGDLRGEKWKGNM